MDIDNSYYASGSNKTSPARSRIKQLGQRLGNLTGNIENDQSVTIKIYSHDL